MQIQLQPHYITQHHITGTLITLQYTTTATTTTLHYTTNYSYAALHYNTLGYTTLYHATVHNTTVHYTTLITSPLIEALWNGRTHVPYEMESQDLFINGSFRKLRKNLKFWCHVGPSILYKGVVYPFYKEAFFFGLISCKIGVFQNINVICLFPHLCVGFLFLVVHFRLPAPAPARRPHTTYSHTHNLLTHNLSTHNLLTHNLLTHTQLVHTQLTHTQLVHTQLAHTHIVHTTCSHTTYLHVISPHAHTLSTHNLLTHNLLTHHLLTHNLSTHNLLTHNLLTHTHNLLQHNLLTHNFSTHNLSRHNLLTHHLATSTVTLRGRRGTWWHRRALCVAGVALMALDWLWWRAWVPVDAVDAAAVCVAGVALGDIDLHFVWQAWHLVTSTFTLHGRRGTYGTGLALVARLGPSWRRGRGRRGTWRHWPSLCVAGVALGGHRPSLCVAGVAWHWTGSGGALGSQLMPWTPRLFAWQAWHLATLTFTLCGRRGTWWHRLSLCVAGVALMALDWLWWRAWVPVDAVDAAAVCVAGLALGDIDLHFAWQAWHLVTSTFTLRGKRGTGWHRPSLCVAGVALGDIDVRFAWQAWHLWHWTGSGGALGSQLTPWTPRLFAWQAWHLATLTFTLCGRHGTWWHRPSLCVAGVALLALDWLWWRAWVPVDAVDVAGVALGDIDLHFA